MATKPAKTSKEYALLQDSEDEVRHLRDMFHYPKMKDLPDGKYSSPYVQ